MTHSLHQMQSPKSIRIVQYILLGTTGLLITGCDFMGSKPLPPIPTVKADPLGGDSDDEPRPKLSTVPKERSIGDFKFTIPAGWEEKAAASSVLMAEYQLPGAAGPARLTFSAAGGGITENLDRWKKQFQRSPDDPEPQESPLKVADKNATLIELKGSFNDMFGGPTPKDDWQLLGVAIPGDGDQGFFIKLTGPKETLAARREEFMTLLNSARH